MSHIKQLKVNFIMQLPKVAVSNDSGLCRHAEEIEIIQKILDVDALMITKIHYTNKS